MDYSLLDEIIIGRVEPHIYAFSTNTIPNYLKVGDTYRPVSVRLKEWEAYFPTLKKEFDAIAKIDDVYFRDFAVHKFLETEKSRIRLTFRYSCRCILFERVFQGCFRRRFGRSD